MKRWLMVVMLLVAMILPTTGCATLSGGQNWQNNVSQIKSDIAMFSKMATRLILNEADTPVEDAVVIEGYLVAIRDLLSVPGNPNFSGASSLVMTTLPAKYHVYGLSIVSLIERYVGSLDLNTTDDQDMILSIITSAINGAIEGVRESVS